MKTNYILSHSYVVFPLFQMKELAAYLLCKVGGKEGSSAEISAVIAAGGGEADEEKITTLLAELEGK